MENKSISEHQRNIFSKNFRYWLSVRGKRQIDVAKDLGITTSTISDWARGNKYPRIDKMQMIADYLCITMADLWNERKPATDKDDGLEAEAKRLFEALPPDKQEIAAAYIRFLAEQERQAEKK